MLRLRRGRKLHVAAATGLECGWLLAIAVSAIGLGRVSRPLAPDALPVSTHWELLPEKVVGPGKCAECHQAETDVWKDSSHYHGSRTLTQSEEAKRIAGALGIRRIKSDQRCNSCHYTVQANDLGKRKTLTGVSCESCHGGAADWIDLHSDLGLTDDTSDSKQRSELRAACASAGMRRPDLVHELASACIGCHLIADEELINVGGHPVPPAFEFVAWSQGSLRHNFVHGADNPESTIERKRVMFVVGQAAELEHALRALATSTDPQGCFAQALNDRCRTACSSIVTLSSLEQIPELERMKRAFGKLTFEAIDGSAFIKAADEVRAASLAFAARHDGSKLESIDSMLPKPEDYKGAKRP